MPGRAQASAPVVRRSLLPGHRVGGSASELAEQESEESLEHDGNSFRGPVGGVGTTHVDANRVIRETTGGSHILDHLVGRRSQSATLFTRSSIRFYEILTKSLSSACHRHDQFRPVRPWRARVRTPEEITMSKRARKRRDRKKKGANHGKKPNA
jgi:hypothetical protein